MPRWSPFEPYFWSLVQKGSGCWEWQGGKDRKGYGRVWKDGGRTGAHRAAYELTRGEIPGDLHICHHCDNPGCVNPDHLFCGTRSDNMRDCTNKGRNKLVSDPTLWAIGDEHWTRQKTAKAKLELSKISDRRKSEWRSGRRTAIRDAKGRIMGTRMAGP